MILVTVDTLRADRLSLYGYPRETSPEIDSFFSGGQIYLSAHSTSPCTIPSVEQILRGRLSLTPGAEEDADTNGSPSLAERLVAAGYSTAAFVENRNLSRAVHGLGYQSYWSFDEALPADPEERERRLRESARALTDQASRWAEGQDPEDPIHLWVHYYSPHRPFCAPAEFHQFSLRDEATTPWLQDPRFALGRTRELLADPAFVEGHRPSDEAPRQMRELVERNDWHVLGSAFSAEQTRFFSDAYDDEIRFVDHEIGRLLRGLAEQGFLDNAWLAFTSDHGEWLGERDVWHHCNSLHQRELHVPLMIRDTSGPSSPARHSQPVSTLDIVPSVLRALRLEIPPVLDGRPLQDGGSHEVLAIWRDQLAVRKDRFKLYLGAEPALFDVQADPDETHDLLASGHEVPPELYRKARHAWALFSDELENTAEIEKKLRALGYL
ncbi:MAG: sulfatase [Holophagales bacterium]|nr:sulfatase [Holophagales bacterium]